MKDLKNKDTRLSASEAISMLKTAIEGNDRTTMLDLLAPEHSELLPDWEKVPETVYFEWEGLAMRSVDIIYK